MATYYPSITDDQAALIRNAPLFFVASADPALEPGGPITVVVCSFEGMDAGIVRLYGKATVTPLEESPRAALLLQTESEHLRTKRHVIEVEVELTGTSCGYGVPVMELVRERRVEDRGRRYKDRKK